MPFLNDSALVVKLRNIHAKTLFPPLCVHLETGFRKKIRAVVARMILTRHSSTSWLPQHFLFVRQVINICVKCRYHALRTIVRTRVSFILS